MRRRVGSARATKSFRSPVDAARASGRNGIGAALGSGCSSMVEQKPSKLTTRVRFPSPAPKSDMPGTCRKLERREATAKGRHSPLTRVDTCRRPRRHMATACPAPRGEVAEWLKAADCKSARASVRWFESSPLHHPAMHRYTSDRTPSSPRSTIQRTSTWRPLPVASPVICSESV